MYLESSKEIFVAGQKRANLFWVTLKEADGSLSKSFRELNNGIQHDFLANPVLVQSTIYLMGAWNIETKGVIYLINTADLKLITLFWVDFKKTRNLLFDPIKAQFFIFGGSQYPAMVKTSEDFNTFGNPMIEITENNTFSADVSSEYNLIINTLAITKGG